MVSWLVFFLYSCKLDYERQCLKSVLSINRLTLKANAFERDVQPPASIVIT